MRIGKTVIFFVRGKELPDRCVSGVILAKKRHGSEYIIRGSDEKMYRVSDYDIFPVFNKNQQMWETKCSKKK